MEALIHVERSLLSSSCITIFTASCLYRNIPFCTAFDECFPALCGICQVHFRQLSTSFVRASNSVHAGDDGAYSNTVWPATRHSAKAILCDTSVLNMGMPRA